MERQLTERLPRLQEARKWEYASTEAARADAAFEAMEEYIWKNQNKVTYYIATQSLLDLCEVTERTQGARVGIR